VSLDFVYGKLWLLKLSDSFTIGSYLEHNKEQARFRVVGRDVSIIPKVGLKFDKDDVNCVPTNNLRRVDTVAKAIIFPDMDCAVLHEEDYSRWLDNPERCNLRLQFAYSGTKWPHMTAKQSKQSNENLTFLCDKRTLAYYCKYFDCRLYETSFP